MDLFILLLSPPPPLFLSEHYSLFHLLRKADFWRFNAMYAAEIYADQPPKNAFASKLQLGDGG